MPQAALCQVSFFKLTEQSGTGKKPTLVPTTLHPTGVYRASSSRNCWCALTAPLHPYPRKKKEERRKKRGIISNSSFFSLYSSFFLFGRYFSVALSSRSLALGVTQQVWFLGCPDFPQKMTSIFRNGLRWLCFDF
jgi:hypothetical protein